jgi:hypothetical protein
VKTSALSALSAILRIIFFSLLFYYGPVITETIWGSYYSIRDYHMQTIDSPQPSPVSSIPLDPTDFDHPSRMIWRIQWPIGLVWVLLLSALWQFTSKSVGAKSLLASIALAQTPRLIWAFRAWALPTIVYLCAATISTYVVSRLYQTKNKDARGRS